MPPHTYQRRNFFCADPINAQCRMGFLSCAGLANHRNVVHTNATPASRIPQHRPQPRDRQVNHLHEGIDNSSDSDILHPQGAFFMADLFDVHSGTPCNANGNDLDEGSPPLPHKQPTSPWHPFANQGAQFNELMHICTQINGDGNPPPYANKQDLHDTIDVIGQGNVPWQSFTIQHTDAERLANDPSAPQWTLAEYDVWFWDPRILLHNQLSSPAFKDKIDYAPCQVYNNNHERIWSDFKSGNWAWKQCNELSNDPECQGAMFVPVILGSDKTTVSVATGNNKYYPLYISNGNVHNNVWRAHIDAVSLVGFFAIPKADREHEHSKEFSDFRCHLFHMSLEAILSSLRPGMTMPEVTLCPDEHYCRVVYGLGPYIADYLEQCLLSCILLMMTSSGLKELRHKWGVVADIMPFTASFPRANIHELLLPDLLHQVIKGSFKDHLVTWVEAFLTITYRKYRAAAIMAEIDRRIAATPSFPGRGFKQWTENDSKALMKVFLPAIASLVPAQMVRAISAFMEFCYLTRQSTLSETDLSAMDDALARFHDKHSIFIDTGVRPNGISLLCQHALMHYRTYVELFSAPNGLCSSITESKHIKAVKKPWRHLNRHLPPGQMLLINQRLDKLAAFKVHLAAQGLFNPSSLDIDQADLEAEDPDDEFDPEEAHFRDDSSLDDVEPDTQQTKYPRHLAKIAAFIDCPKFPELVGRFLYDQRNPDASIQATDMQDISVLPVVEGRVDVFNSAIARFCAPSDLSGVNGMQRQRIHSCTSWRNGPARHDCVYAEKDPLLPGFQGLYIAQVILFFSFTYQVHWFTPIGDEPCELTGMWMIEPEWEDDLDSKQRVVSVIHLDSIMRAAHLIGVYGSQHIPHNLKHTNSLAAFSAYYVNKFSDYHAYEIAY
ncbi:hypothetical protein F4604DRAFT_1883217 [Suillus subluteus]|nr:hypothetical protein F4604DRAFT_1883217 [Suillus subluteus]